MAVSVVICTYNGKKFLLAQLESLTRQSFMPDEIIICDDCSTDGSYSLLENFDFKSIKVVFVRQPVNLGYVRNFESGILAASGKYILLCDQDDVWTNDHVEKIVQRFSSGVSLVCGRSRLIDANGFFIKNLIFPTAPRTRRLDDFTKLCLTNYCQGNSMGFTKDIVAMALPFPSDIKYHDHWIALVAALHGRIVLLEDVITHYRVHECSVSTSHWLLGGSQPPLNIFANLTEISGRFSNADSYILRRFIMIRRRMGGGFFAALLFWTSVFPEIISLFEGKRLRILRAARFVAMNFHFP